jgi:hypothetical protein
MPEINLYKRDLTHFNEREFSEEVINKVNWEQIFTNTNDTNLTCQNFFNTFFYHLDEFAPYRKVTKKEFKLMSKPWISNEILEKCKSRDSLLKSISKETDPVKLLSLRNEYKKLRNEVTNDKRVGKKSYYTAYFERNKHKSSEIWKGIKLETF